MDRTDDFLKKLNAYRKDLESMHFEILNFHLCERHNADEQFLNLTATIRVSKVFINQLMKVLEPQERPAIRLVKRIIE